MAQRVSNIRVADGGGAYIIEFCDGTEEVLPCISCGDEPEIPQPPPNVETPSGSRCDYVWKYAIEFIQKVYTSIAKQ